MITVFMERIGEKLQKSRTGRVLLCISTLAACAFAIFSALPDSKKEQILSILPSSGRPVETEPLALPFPPLLPTVEDMTFDEMNQTLDIRLQNNAPYELSILRAYIKIVDHGVGPSLIYKQQISDKALFKFDENYTTGKIKYKPLEEIIPANSKSRIQIDFSWSDSAGPRDGHYYKIIPALKTSAGILRLSPINVHIQQGYDAQNTVKTPFTPPILMSDQEAAALPILWPQ